MTKIVLEDVTSGFNSGPTISANNDVIVEAIENTISRDGTSPNDMEADLDMGGHRITNLAAPIEDGDAVRLQDILDGITVIQEVPWDDVLSKPAIIEAIALLADLAALRKVPIVTETTTSLAASTSNDGNFTRFTNAAAKTYTFSGAAGLVAEDEYHGRNIGAGDLTITATNGMTINAPADGTLVVPQNGTFTIKIVSATEADLFGHTVAA